MAQAVSLPSRDSSRLFRGEATSVREDSFNTHTMLNWLLVFVPIAAGLEFFAPHHQSWIFITSCIAIIPLAGWLGEATEHIAEKVGEGVGGLLNATFGNAAELIIASVALSKGLDSVVKASLTGSILGNTLLVLGASVLAGGLRHRIQSFNAVAVRSQASMMTLASIALIAPALFHYLAGAAGSGKEQGLSLEIAIVLAITYVLSLVFSLHTHKRFFAGEVPVADGDDSPTWGMPRAFLVLGAATALIACMSEILVGSVEAAAASLGMTSVFVGVIVVAIVGNAAEHSTAVMMAMKNRMDLTFGIALGSSVQIAMFVAPVLVGLSYFVGPHPMDLVFSPAEVLAVGLAVVIAGEVASDGQSNWLEGVQLLAVYLILALMFYFLPEAAVPAGKTH